MRKFRSLFLIIPSLILLSGFMLGKEINPPNRGYFKNHEGKSCWYKTRTQKNKYFTFYADTSWVHEFEKPNAMTNNIVSKRMIASVITRFYIGTKFQSDTKFELDPEKWKKANPKKSPKRGYIIKSTNYPIPLVWIDFVTSTDGNYIIKVIHAHSFNY